ncbi:MAG: AI-2E family transporter [Burkholderiales bacterium]|nr:AI-2E family transporter [Burkholderiales bacterium]
MALPVDRPNASSATVLVAFIGAIALLYFARDIAIPLALSLLLSFILSPLVMRLRRWKIPRIPAVLVVVAVTFAVIGAIGALVGEQLVKLAGEIPQYESNLQEKIKSFRTGTEGGAFDRIGRMVADLQQEITAQEAEPAAQDLDPARPLRNKPIPVEVHQPEPTSFAVIGDTLGVVAGPVGTAGLVIVFVIFMLLQREDMRERLLRLAGTGQLQSTTEALDDAGQRVSRYLVTQLLINTCYGVPLAIGLHFIGVPYAILWGCLGIVLRFIPYLGPVLAMILPLGLAFAVDPGWSMLFWTMGLFAVLELVTNNVLEPWLYGSSTGISTMAIVVAAVFWTWLWGPVGLFMSTPLTVCLIVLGRYVPHLKFLDVLLGDQPVLPPGERFYQRMLAMDSEGAEDYAEQFLDEKSLEALFDEMIVPALSLAEQSRQRGALDDKQQRYLHKNTRELIENLIGKEIEQEADDDEPGDEVGPAAEAGRPISATVLCVPADDEADEIIARMLSHLLERREIPARVISADAILEKKLDAAERKAVEVLCVSALPPNALLRARAVTKVLRSRFWTKKIIVGLWHVDLDDERLRKRLGVLTADHVVTSLAEAANQVTVLWRPAIDDTMEAAPIPENDDLRCAALEDLSLLNAEPEDAFDLVTSELVRKYEVPIAAVVLIDKHREVWKSAVGLPAELAAAGEIPRSLSLGGHVVAANDMLVVEDLWKDHRFANNPLLRINGIRFFAGAPLRTAEGDAIGALCILDNKPRRLDDREAASLRDSAEALMKEVEIRQARLEADSETVDSSTKTLTS